MYHLGLKWANLKNITKEKPTFVENAGSIQVGALLQGDDRLGRIHPYNHIEPIGVDTKRKLVEHLVITSGSIFRVEDQTFALVSPHFSHLGDSRLLPKPFIDKFNGSNEV